MIRYCVALLAVVSTISLAQADVLDVAYQYVEAGGTMSVSLDGVHRSNDAAGIMTVATANPVGPLASQIPATTWVACAGELTQPTSFAFSPYTVNLLHNVLPQPTADLIRQLWGQHYDLAWNSSTPIFHGGAHTGYWPGQPAATPENVNALSLPFAVWEIVYDFDGTLGSLNLGAGRFQMSLASDTVPPTVLNVQNWLSTLVLPSQYQGPLPVLVHMANPTQQDLIGLIPEPATLALLGLAAWPLLGRKK